MFIIINYHAVEFNEHKSNITLLLLLHCKMSIKLIVMMLTLAG